MKLNECIGDKSLVNPPERAAEAYMHASKAKMGLGVRAYSWKRAR